MSKTNFTAVDNAEAVSLTPGCGRFTYQESILDRIVSAVTINRKKVNLSGLIIVPTVNLAIG